MLVRRTFHPNGQLRSEVEVLRHGRFRLWGPDGSLLIEGGYHHGQPHGRWRRFHPNGAVKSEVECRHGQRHGVMRCWSPVGVLTFEGRFADGEPDGRWRTWRLDGTSIEECLYERGRLVGGAGLLDGAAGPSAPSRDM